MEEECAHLHMCISIFTYESYMYVCIIIHVCMYVNENGVRVYVYLHSIRTCMIVCR